MNGTMSQSIVEKYIPWAKDAVEVERVLKSMDLPESEIADIFRGNTVCVFGRITDPGNGRHYSVGILHVQLKMYEGTWHVTIEDMPCRAFFDALEKEERDSAMAAEENEVVARLSKENRRLKELLDSVVNGY